MPTVTLIKAQPRHVQFVYDLFRGDEVMRGMGLHKPIPAPEWRNIITGLYETHLINYLMKVGEILVGYVGFQGLSKEDKRSDICVAVLPQMQNKGIAKAALQEVMSLAAQTPQEGGIGLQCVVANIIEDNQASRSLFKASGFEEASVVPSYYRFGSARYNRVVSVWRSQ